MAFYDIFTDTMKRGWSGGSKAASDNRHWYDPGAARQRGGAWGFIGKAVDPAGVFSGSVGLDWSPGAANIQDVGLGTKYLTAMQQIAPQYYGYGDYTQMGNQGMGMLGESADYYRGVLSGEQPSLAELQMKAGHDAAQKSQLSMAAGASGANRALARRSAAQNMGNIQQQGVREAAALRAQETQAAAGGLAQTGAATGGLEATEAQLEVQQRQFEQQMEQAYQQLVHQYISTGASMDQAQMQAQLEVQRLRQEEQARIDAQRLEAAKARQESEQKHQGGLLGAAGAVIGALSDERTKEAVDDVGDEIDDFLRKLKAKTWKYKTEHRAEGGDGRRIGIMAQALEESKLGKLAVHEGKDGLKRIDGAQSLGLLYAAASRLDDRLSKLEGK